ncbi:DUF4331 family protein [Micromonospora sp. NPDC047134]|uniref:DUF4331 family protein n=1 Tax=Micromonospora sp. NPDC047134 TaxID=3154340 RepID=UPI0033F44F50
MTLIANYVPLQLPSGGPNFFEFGDDVRYEIHVDNDGDGRPDITYRFEFSTEITNPNSFLYNTGPIEALDSENWNRRQFYRLTRIAGGEGASTGQPVPLAGAGLGDRGVDLGLPASGQGARGTRRRRHQRRPVHPGVQVG